LNAAIMIPGQSVLTMTRIGAAGAHVFRRRLAAWLRVAGEPRTGRRPAGGAGRGCRQGK